MKVLAYEPAFGIIGDPAKRDPRTRQSADHSMVYIIATTVRKAHELAAEYGDRVKIVKMDIDANPGTPGRYGVRAIPTVLAFQNGQVVEQLQGARPKADFEAMVTKLLG